MNIYVGSLARSVTEQELRELFERKGVVTSVKIMKHKFTGDPRGFGFLEMPNADEAQQAIAELDGYALAGQTLRVNEAREPEARTSARRPQYGNRFGSSNGGGSSSSDYRSDRGGQGGNGGGSRSGGSSSSRGDSWQRTKRF